MPFFPTAKGFYPKTPAPAWTPASLADLDWWVRADELVMGVGFSVEQWVDKSGGGNNAVQADPLKQGVLFSTIALINNQPGVLMDGLTMRYGKPATTSQWLAMVLVDNTLVDLDGIYGNEGADVGVRYRTTPAFEGSGGGYAVTRQPSSFAVQPLYVEFTNSLPGAANGFGGYFPGGGRNAHCWLVECIGCTAQPSAGDLTQLRSYIEARYGFTP